MSEVESAPATEHPEVDHSEADDTRMNWLRVALLTIEEYKCCEGG